MKWIRRILLATLALLAIAGVVWARYLRMTRVPEPALSAKLSRATLAWDGRDRSFSSYVPAQTEEHPALLLALHGSDGNGDQARETFGYEFDRLADEHGFIAVYPDGVEGHWNDCRKAAPYAAKKLAIDDVGYLGALVARFVQENGVDPQRVFVTGISNGGQMALRLALEAPTLVRGVAPVIASLPTDENMDCKPSGRPVSILLMNGTADPMNPYEGGTVALYGIWGNRGTVRSTKDTIGYWAALAGYTTPPEITLLPDQDRSDGSTVERRRWHGLGRRDVALDTIRGGGHTVPHPRVRLPRILGPTNGDIVAAREIWSFFEAAP
jgi:polyhydroxybutyrate depolymerase